MDHHVFLEDNERIRNFVQLTYITLSSTGAVPIGRLEDAYRAMEPVIHQKVGLRELDCAALSYAALRLPFCATKVGRVVLGQSESILEESGIPMSAWTEVFARSRRRRYLYDGAETLICFIASKSDVDDIIPSLLALQIEWNKAHAILARKELPPLPPEEAARLALIAGLLEIDSTDARKFASAFQEDLEGALAEMRRRPMDLYVRNLESSYTRYRRETETWWRQIAAECPGIEERPVYFVSSNTHSLINLMSGYAEAIRGKIMDFAATDPDLAALARAPRAEAHSSLLYYLLMKYEQQDRDGERAVSRIAYEKRVGVRRIAAEKTLDVPTQVIDLAVLASSGAGGDYADRLRALAGSDAMVLNIDYPLGRTAYFLLNKLAEHIVRIKGVYVVGKAASLFADRGDIIIPSSIIDQHTRNEYFLENCIRVGDIEPYLDSTVHAIYDNQKAVTVLGTFLQNKQMLSAFLSAGVTDLEMEAGPYLAALYEIARPKRYPEQETISLRMSDMDLGIVHYVSDNPLAGRHLDRSLDLDGVDATYAATRAVLNRIVDRELREVSR
jgi:hypothetical protein